MVPRILDREIQALTDSTVYAPDLIAGVTFGPTGLFYVNVQSQTINDSTPQSGEWSLYGEIEPTAAAGYEVRATVLAAVPGGEERISYGMPAVFRHGVVVYYAAFRKHIGLYPPVSDPVVKAKVAAYAGPKGNLQFPLRDAMPLALIAEVAKARLAENLLRVAATKGKRASRGSEDRR